jgi:hypothetical protein
VGREREREVWGKRVRKRVRERTRSNLDDPGAAAPVHRRRSFPPLPELILMRENLVANPLAPYGVTSGPP